jgi:hypothetical protein
MPVYLISLFETEFFLAEYHARYGTPADAETHYKAAIEASFASAGATGASDIYTTQYPWNNSKYAELIGIQKWIALGGTNNFEAWSEMRRLKYPAFSTVKGADIFNESTDTYSPDAYIPGTLYTPVNRNSELGDATLLQRFKYAENSATRNNNAPENPGDGVPVFWAK